MKFQCLFRFEICTPEGRGGEKGGSANFKTKHTEPFIPEYPAPVYFDLFTGGPKLVPTVGSAGGGTELEKIFLCIKIPPNQNPHESSLFILSLLRKLKSEGTCFSVNQDPEVLRTISRI